MSHQCTTRECLIKQQDRAKGDERHAQRVAYCDVIVFPLLGCLAITLFMVVTGRWPLTWAFFWIWGAAVLLVLLTQICALWVWLSFRS